MGDIYKKSNNQKIAATLLLGIMMFFIFTATFSTTSNMTSQPGQHDGCFDQQCGPIQHLLHNYIVSQPTTFLTSFKKTKLLTTNNTGQILFLEIESPPPRLS
ncbi:MAG: hypothetical protein JW816_00765 [Candidatus Buchananbacteria bacterium]|nr:hypothetical protein [Candidatus Buchananbacteria bacterium]